MLARLTEDASKKRLPSGFRPNYFETPIKCKRGSNCQYLCAQKTMSPFRQKMTRTKSHR